MWDVDESHDSQVPVMGPGFHPGMVSTAHEQFKKLRMWPEAVECLIIAERNVEAEDKLKDGGY